MRATLCYNKVAMRMPVAHIINISMKGIVLE
jgi:hypothetical protein